MADFDPRQLDALEDALEDLEVDGDLADFELAPELLERLAEYQQVLALTRDAFPLDDPPEGLLDSVLAEAREVARNAPPITPERTGGWRRAWDRWRSSVVPVAALAGAAALVLWLAKPGDDQNLAVVDRPSHEDAKKEEAREPATMLERDSAEAAGSASKDARVEPIEEPELELELDDDEPIGSVPTQEPAKAVSKKKATAGAGGASVPPPTPAVEPEPVAPLNKDDAYLDLERADAARRKGDCDRARTIYDKVIAASGQANAIAKAKAGIGLCFEQEGKASTAEQWFEQARASNPGIDVWIRGELEDQPMPGEKKKAKANDAYEALDSL